MVKIITLQIEVNLDETKYSRFDNNELLDMYMSSGLTLFDFLEEDRQITVLSVEDK